MEHNVFSPLEIDAIGEIMNISLGSSATAISNMLDHRVDITTPKVSVVSVRDFSLGNLNPAIGVEIKYIAGLEGSNIMLLKRSDIKVIVDILLGTETPDEEFELNELTVSAVCEVMNQMMGAASTALSDFLGRMVNISPPESIELNDFSGFKETRFKSPDEPLVIVRFSLKIEDKMESEFINIMSVPFARDLVSNFELSAGEEKGAGTPNTKSEEDSKRNQEEAEKGTVPGAGNGNVQSEGGGMNKNEEPQQGGKLSQEEIEKLMSSMASGQQQETAPKAESPQRQETQKQQSAAQSAPQQPQQPPQTPPPPPYQPYGQGYYPPGYAPYPYPPAGYAEKEEPKVISTQPVHMPEFAQTENLSKEQSKNLDLILSVPLEVTVEIGRTRRKVQDILEFTKGTLVVLDKLAGDQVDLFVNGKCIAKGDVVVIDDNFGIRITEIVQKPELGDLTQE